MGRLGQLHRSLPAWSAPPWRDVALAVALAVLDLAMFTLGSPEQVLGVFAPYAAVGYAALAWRRRAPVTVFVVMTVHSLAAAAVLETPQVESYHPTLGLLLALFTVALVAKPATSWRAWGAAILVLAYPAVVFELGQLEASGSDASQAGVAIFITLLYALFASAALAAGRRAGASRREIDSLERRRADEAQAAAAAAAEAVAVERRRIARELHDILSHSVSVMVLQATGARTVLASDPARAEDALGHIEAVGKESMVELRRLLGVLDAGPNEPEESAADGRPPGVADVPDLVDGLRRSGLRVTLLEEGSPTRLDPSVDLSVYRIVQEALTNCIKHSGREAEATVRLAWAERLLVVEVVDDGGAGAETDGSLSTEHGLPGLRERARAVGGHLEAGPDPQGGYRVSATLPVSSTEGSDRTPVREGSG